MVNKKIMVVSFVISLCLIGASAFMFVTVLNRKIPKAEQKKQTQTQIQKTTETEYYQPNDNVGAVSFTEDQLTELARKIFFEGDYLKDFKIELDEGIINMSAKISNKQNLLKAHSKLKKYETIISSIVDKQMSLTATLKNQDGRAALKVSSVNLAGIELDPEIVSPFIEKGDLPKLFDTEYNNVEITHGSIIFKNGVPKILEY